MNHIYEGIDILHLMGNRIRTVAEAFAIHPLVQGDAELAQYFCILEDGEDNIHRSSLIYALEYRNIANQYLSHRDISRISDIKLSPIMEVNEMLIADKVQNYKDFLIYHYGTHPRSEELNQYFNNWLTRLDAHDIFEKYAGSSVTPLMKLPL